MKTHITQNSASVRAVLKTNVAVKRSLMDAVKKMASESVESCIQTMKPAKCASTCISHCRRRQIYLSSGLCVRSDPRLSRACLLDRKINIIALDEQRVLQLNVCPSLTSKQRIAMAGG